MCAHELRSSHSGRKSYTLFFAWFRRCFVVLALFVILDVLPSSLLRPHEQAICAMSLLRRALVSQLAFCLGPACEVVCSTGSAAPVSYALLGQSLVLLARAIATAAKGRPADACLPVVAVCTDDGLRFALSEAACVLLGAAFAPLGARDPPQRRAALLRLLRPRAVVDDSFFTGNADAIAAIAPFLSDETHAATPPSPAELEALLGLLHPPAVRHNSGGGEAGDDPCLFAPGVVCHVVFTSGSTGDPKAVVTRPCQLSDYLASIAPWLGLRAPFVRLPSPAAATAPPMRVLLASAATFDPSIGDVFGAWCSGAVLVAAPRPAIEGALTAVVAAARPTSVVATPALWSTVDRRTVAAARADAWSSAERLKQRARCGDGCDQQASNSPALKRDDGVRWLRIALGGEAMPPALAAAWAGEPSTELIDVYGTTEATVYQLARRVTCRETAESVSLGDPIGPSIAVRVEPLPAGDAVDVASPEESEQWGLLSVHGSQVGEGYAVFGDVNLSGGGGVIATRPFSDGDDRCHATGDVVSSLPLASGSDEVAGKNHRWRLRGRRDWQVKLSGHRTGLEDIATALERAAGPRLVVRCVCVCVGCGARGDGAKQTPVVVAAVELTAEARAEEASSEGGAAPISVVAKAEELPPQSLLGRVLRAVAVASLPPHAVPGAFYRWAGMLPCGPNGKADRRAIAAAAAGWADLVSSAEADTANDAAAVNDGAMRQPPALDALERCVASVWAAFFGAPLNRFGRTAHFAFLGGDSLAAHRVGRLTADAVAALRRSDNPPTAEASQTATATATDGDWGAVPPPFHAATLLRFPRLGEYCAALRAGGADVGVALATESDGEMTNPQLSAAVDDSAAGLLAELLFECVAAARPMLVEALLAAGATPDDRAAAAAGSGRVGPQQLRAPLLHVAAALPAPTAEADDAAAATTRALLAAGAWATATAAFGVSAAHIAAQRRSGPAVLAALLGLSEPSEASVACRPSERGAPVARDASRVPATVQDARGQTLLHHAARAGSAACAAFITARAEGDWLARDRWQRTPLHWAAVNGHSDVLRTALAEGRARIARGERAGRGKAPLSVAVGARLARRHTHLPYESLSELSRRVHGEGNAIAVLCEELENVFSS